MAGRLFSSHPSKTEPQSRWTEASSSIKSRDGFFYPPSPQATTSLSYTNNAATTVDSNTRLRSVDAHMNVDNSVLYTRVQPLPADAPTHRRPTSRRSQLRITTPLKSVLIIAIYLPIPTSLSLVSMAAGHGILRSSLPNSRFSSISIVPSIRAGAVGGAILTLPLALLLYLLLFPTKSEPDPEDFFDDEDGDGGIRGLWQTSYGAYVVCALIALCLGGAAGALGTECLPEGDGMLSSSDAAKAGLVGGVVLCASMALLVFASVAVWTRTRKRSHG